MPLNCIQATSNEKRRLERCVNAHCRVLGSGLVGAYLHGSRAGAGPINPGSDFDLLVVLRNSLPKQTEQEILQIHKSAELVLDSTYVTSDQANSDVVPTPILFVVKHFGDVQLLHLPDGSRDFPLLRQDVLCNGRCLHGAGIHEVVKPPGRELIVKTLQIILPHISERFKYPALQFCRVLHACATGQTVSKVQAARWGLQNLDPQWHPTIRQDLQVYLLGREPSLPDKRVLSQMAACCERELATLASGFASPHLQ